MANFDAVIKELRAERDRIDQAIEVLTSLNAGSPVRVRLKRRISPAGIARIRAAAKARWARGRAGKKK